MSGDFWTLARVGFFFGANMARIRSIKPEFWADFKMANELTRDYRLFYIGLWNEADDDGRFQAHPARLKGAIFPYDDDIHGVFIEDALRTLSDTKRVILYEAEGEPYGQLTHFAKHQKINRPSPSRKPPPPQELQGCPEPSQNPHGGISEGSPQEQVAGSMDQGTGSMEEDDAQGRGSPGAGEVGDSLVLRPNELLAEWIDRQAIPPDAQEKKKQAGKAKQICDKHNRRDIALAFKGMAQVYPYSNGEPWDLFDLDRKFTKAKQAVVNHPEIQAMVRKREIEEELGI